MSIDFTQIYDRPNALSFLRDDFLPEDFTTNEEDINLTINSETKLQKAHLLGEVPSLDLKVYEFTHKSESDPRVTITKEAFRFLANRGEQRALVFFISENSPNYRFSLITIDLKPDGKKIEKIISNPKRYSYYLGPNAKVHTPTKYLIKKGRTIDFCDLKSRFSIEVVNKEFFEQISKYFMRLVGGKRGKEDYQDGELILPSNIEHIKKQEFVVRLIGRIIFCYFLKKKNSMQGNFLMPEKLLSSDFTEKNYYHNILEPLFFEVLNKPLKDRDRTFRNNIFDSIPFLNGGLFEPHMDDLYETDNQLKISRYINNLLIPDDWFKSLFETLETYNFTIDENTSTDIDLSVDPEMLGRIFENLLAEINPETGETARKATGSYYTPREIVDYMVNESLKYYLLEKTKIGEEKIDQLIQNTFDNIDLSEEEREVIIDAFSSLKVIDPACGSGAFPMGILQKTVSILQEVDPDSKLWLERQLEKIPNITLRNTFKKQTLGMDSINYIFKLGLIQNSIYGVDIQEIGVEISKLRVFLSLIVDAKVDDEKENRGLIPLPNLEFKFVCANSLIDLPEEEIYLVDSHTGYSSKPTNELKKLSEEYFNSFGEEKERIKKEFKEKQVKLLRIFLDYGKNKDDKKSFMLSEWDPFSDKPSSWFNPDWMFGVKDGFDIVIANPPYGGKLEKMEELIKSFKFYDSRKNSASFFIEKTKTICRLGGLVSFIVPKSLSFVKGWESTRNFVLKEKRFLDIVDVSEAFEEVLLEQVIITFKNEKCNSQYTFTTGEGWGEKIKRIGSVSNIVAEELKLLPIYIDSAKVAIFNKLKINSILLKYISKTFRGLPFQKRCSTKGFTLILRGDNIGKYLIYGEVPKVQLSKDEYSNNKIRELMQPKIISQNIVAHVKTPFNRLIIMATYDKEGFLSLDTVMNTFLTDKNFYYEYVLAILNSRLAEWFYYWFVYNRAVRTMHFDEYYMGKLSIKLIDKKNQQPFFNLVNQILALTQSDDYLENQEKQAQVKEFEKEIDQMVYKLYDLTEEEIKIVEETTKFQ